MFSSILRRGHIGLVLICLVAVSCVSLPGRGASRGGDSNPVTAERNAAVGGRQIIVNRDSGKVLDAFGSNLIVFNDYGNDNQRWNVANASNGSFTIRTIQSGNGSVDVEGTGNGSNVGLAGFNNGDLQRFNLNDVGDGWYEIRPVGASNRCIGVSTSGERINVESSNCAGRANQQWAIGPNYRSPGGTSPRPSQGGGNVTWSWGENPSRYPSDIRATIERSMNYAVGMYNQHSSLRRSVRVTYNSGVPTADANINGAIRFGGLRNDRVALHEIAHTFGVGTTSQWSRNRNGNQWTGRQALNLLASFDGNGSRLNADNQHFWPYGLNYDGDEDSPRNRVRHVQMVQAMVCDMGLRQYGPSC